MFHPLMSRRGFLADGGMNLGCIGVAVALAQAGDLSAAAPDPLAPKTPHFPPRAKRFVHMFLEGGPSHLDLLDPKPELKRRDGQIHAAWKGILFGSPFRFFRRGQSGIEISELLPALGGHADDLTILRSLHTDIPAHGQGTRMMMSGHSTLTRPSYGAWLTYGLGTENANLPAYVALGASPSDATIGSGFLPPVYQGNGIPLRPGQDPIPFLRNPHMPASGQRAQLDLLNDFNREFGERAPHESPLEARIRSFELSFRMQSTAPEALDIHNDTEATRQRYGNSDWGQRLLTARRLLERGVRVLRVQAGPRARQSRLGPSFRSAYRRDDRQLRPANLRPRTTRLTRLAGRDVRRGRLVSQEAPSPNTPQPSLSAKRRATCRLRTPSGTGPREQIPLAHEHASARLRASPRCRAVRLRDTRCKSIWAIRGRRGIFSNPRRTIYALIDRPVQPLLLTFGVPDNATTAGERHQSTSAVQALYLMNSGLLGHHAGKLLENAEFGKMTTLDDRADWLFRRVLQRAPSAKEMKSLTRFLQGREADLQAWRELVQTLLMGNEFAHTE